MLTLEVDSSDVSFVFLRLRNTFGGVSVCSVFLNSLSDLLRIPLPMTVSAVDFAVLGCFGEDKAVDCCSGC